MEERDWQIIKHLYEHKNITKTARILYLSQPALTARIKHIEDRLDTKIITRGNKGISFTPAGEFVANYANEMVRSLNRFREELSNMDNEVRGVLRIAAPNFVNYRLSKLLGEFKDLYPSVEYNIFTAQSSDVIAGMNSQDLHFGFVLNDFGWRDDEKMVVAEDTLCIANRQEFQLEDLPRMVRVDYVMDSYHRNFLDTWWENNFASVPKTGILVSSLDVCMEMINNGLGYAIVPSMAIAENDKLYKLTLQDNDKRVVLRKTWLLYRKELMHLSITKAFMEFMKKVRFN